MAETYPLCAKWSCRWGAATWTPPSAFDTFQPGTTRRGRGTYATDAAGQERMITRRVGGENRVTQAGRRFYRQSYSRYIIHVPLFLVRRSTGQRFRDDR